MHCCINGGNVIRLLCLSVKLLKFEIQKCGQILCAHKPYFLMPGHICTCIIVHVYIWNSDSRMVIVVCARVCMPMANFRHRLYIQV